MTDDIFSELSELQRRLETGVGAFDAHVPAEQMRGDANLGAGVQRQRQRIARPCVLNFFANHTIAGVAGEVDASAIDTVYAVGDLNALETGTSALQE